MMKQRFWLAALLVVASAIPVLAQRSTATVRGTVTDTTGGVLLGAKVTVKSEATGFTRTATTNAAGLYSFTDLSRSAPTRSRSTFPASRPRCAARWS